MTYRAIRRFRDITNGLIYEVGDTFPHFGLKVTEKRIEELSSRNNMSRTPLIEECVSEAERDAVESQVGVSSSVETESKRRQRKRQGRHARTDS